MTQYLTEIFSNPSHAIFIILNIILIEVMLSIDNAAVLATMVIDLPKEQRSKALKYGIAGAFIFRGLAMIFASILIQVWWLKPLGGLYLLYLVYGYFKGKASMKEDDDYIDKKENWLYKNIIKYIGLFWSTIVLIELMDMSFSIDNIFAVVAFTPNIVMVCFGVFIGILAMRFVAMQFVKLLEKYEFLEDCAFIVIFVLGLKLISSILSHYYVTFVFLDSEKSDYIMSAITLLIFLVPLTYSFIKSKLQK